MFQFKIQENIDALIKKIKLIEIKERLSKTIKQKN